MPYKCPVVAWNSEKISMYDKSTKATVEGVSLKPIHKRFTVNAFTGLDETKED